MATSSPSTRNKRTSVSRRRCDDDHLLILYLGIRTAKYTVSDINARITDYENKLRELKSAFSKQVTLQTGVTVFRMMNVVEHIGRPHLF